MSLEVFSKQFKGTCRISGKYGHKAAEWSQKKTSSDTAGRNQGRFQGKCLNCGTWGHKAKFGQKSACQRSEKSYQAIDLQESESEEPCQALAEPDGNA